MIQKFAKLIPGRLQQRSGSVFYSGRKAFSGHARLYMLGLNPGGCPIKQADETVAWHTNKVLHDEPADWSAYHDESWRNALPGRRGMQPRILHMLRRVGLEPGCVPASNIVFVRSTREATVDGGMQDLADLCWGFHQAVLEHIKPSAILCFGRTAGEYVRRKVGANRVVNEFVEFNNRRWKSVTYRGTNSPGVVVATHPSIADWTNVDTDPSELIIKALAQ